MTDRESEKEGGEERKKERGFQLEHILACGLWGLNQLAEREKEYVCL